MKEQHVPTLDLLSESGRAEGGRVPDRDGDESLHQIGPIRRRRPGQVGAPVVADQAHLLHLEGLNDRANVTNQVVHSIQLDVVGLITEAASAKVRHRHPVSGPHELGRDLIPQRRGVGPTVQEQDGGTVAVHVKLQFHVTIPHAQALHPDDRTPTD